MVTRFICPALLPTTIAADEGQTEQVLKNRCRACQSWDPQVADLSATVYMLMPV
jgi:coenzyme F420-reducing hydrogenase beta subunit